MAYFFRAIEKPGGSWICRRGSEDYDEHETLGGSLEHLAVLAAAQRPAEIILHALDGTVETVLSLASVG